MSTVCDVHKVPLLWYDDGDAESGPHEPYEDCPKCRDEHLHPMLYCDVCEKESRQESTSLTNVHFDPTVVSHLACGHSIM